MPIDPVCHQSVNVRHAAAFCEYEGKIYYFCSSGCHKTFTAKLHQISGGSPVDGEASAPRRQFEEQRKAVARYP